MTEKSMLTDCLESLKHVAARYQEALFACDNDHVRDTLQDIMVDRVEQQASVFSLMHQMGLIETRAAEDGQVPRIVEEYRHVHSEMSARHHAADGPDASADER